MVISFELTLKRARFFINTIKSTKLYWIFILILNQICNRWLAPCVIFKQETKWKKSPLFWEHNCSIVLRQDEKHRSAAFALAATSILVEEVTEL